jgi:TolA-binding protein
MKVVGLHPEDLFDKWVQGRLTDAEGARLQAHLDACAACRFELQVRRDFAEAPVEMPSAAPVFIPAPSTAPGPASEFRVRPRRRVRRFAGLFLAAAALIAGASVASLGNGARDFIRRSPIGVFLSRASAPGASERATASRGPLPQAPVHEVPAPSPARAEEQRAVPLAELPVEEHAEKRSAEARAPESGAQTPSALFHAANQARRSGDDERAIALYRSLEAQFPKSEEGRLSHATLGRLMLDRGDPKLALADFDEYLSHGSAALGEEALVGRALALGKLEQSGAEAAAWREVLRRFPKSVHARLARTRLAALGEP